MKINLKINPNQLAQKLLDEKLSDFGYKYSILNYGEFEFLEKVPNIELNSLINDLNNYGIEIVENEKSILVQKIKDSIIEMIQNSDLIQVKTSVYLADKLNLNYNYLSNLFSEQTFTSIENFMILQKIEVVKQFLNDSNMNLTEIAHQLNYSSVAHLSTQFKNTTGITPSVFSKIIAKRKENFNTNLQ